MFKISRKALQAELALLVQIAGQKNVIPALSTIRVIVKDGRASLLVSSIDVALQTEIETQGDDWQGCIPARQLYDIVRLTSNVEEVVFRPQPGQIEITWGRARHRLPLVDFQRFPEVDPVENETGRVAVKTSDLTDSLERVLPCAATDNSAKFMCQGVKIEAKENRMKVVATNTHRLGVATIPCEGEIDVFIPLFTASLLPRFTSEIVTIWRNNFQACFQFGSRVLTSRLPTGTFPNWEMIMPKHLPFSATVDTKEFIGALKRSDVTRNETYKQDTGKIRLGVVLVFSKDEIVIDSRHSDVHGRSEEPVDIESNLNGDLIYMGMNPDYLMDFLRFAGEKTECDLKDGKGVLRMTDGSNFEYVVVPQNV